MSDVYALYRQVDRVVLEEEVLNCEKLGVAEVASLRYCHIIENNMKLSITYAELQDYVAGHFHKTVNVGYVDGDTMSVSVPIKVLGFLRRM